MRSTICRLSGLTGLLGLLLACTGGQTGESTGARYEPCVRRLIEVEPDVRIPSGDFTPGQLIEPFRGATAPGFVLPKGTSFTDHSLGPDDALEVTEVAIDFEPTDPLRASILEGSLCFNDVSSVPGTLTVRAGDGEIVSEATGSIVGTPGNAGFAHDGEPSGQLSYVRVSQGVLTGALYANESWLRFPVACGGVAQLPLDEPLAGADLPLPSDALDRLQGLELEVVWSESDRSPLELAITADGLSCYTHEGSSHREPPLTLSITPVDVAITIADLHLDIERRTELGGSEAAVSSDVRRGSGLSVCQGLEGEALAAVGEKLVLALVHAQACLTAFVGDDSSLEMALEITGEATIGVPDDPEDRLFVEERVVVRETDQ